MGCKPQTEIHYIRKFFQVAEQPPNMTNERSTLMQYSWSIKAVSHSTVSHFRSSFTSLPSRLELFTVYLYCPFLGYLVFTLNLLHCHFYPYTGSLPRLRFSRTDDHSRLRFSEYMTILFSASRTRICYQLYWQWRNEQEKHVRRNGGRVYSDRSFKPMPKFLSSTEAYKGVTQMLETKCWV